jgi:hypothetical protein
MNRMRLWRTKKMSQEAGRLAQICVWAPERAVALTRQICARLAEPNERGETLRNRLRKQLDRRRTIAYEWRGFSSQVEIDYPFVGPWWHLVNIGGRIIGPMNTHIELSPEEAEELKNRLSRCCDKEIEAWLQERKLQHQVRDNTGVVVGRFAPEDPNRPASEASFTENEAAIAKAVTEAAFQSRKPPIDDPSIIEFEGVDGFPSFCQIAHRKQGGRVQFALIHMENSGSSPTNVFESLATFLRQRFYPHVDAGKIDWFDVYPADVYILIPLTIHSVTMKHANGVYSYPEWHSTQDTISEDWRTLITDIIARSRAVRQSAQEASPKVTRPRGSRQIGGQKPK